MFEKLWYRNMKGKGCLVDTNVDGRIILKKIGYDRANGSTNTVMKNRIYIEGL